jgi:hypothetical protein
MSAFRGEADIFCPIRSLLVLALSGGSRMSAASRFRRVSGHRSGQPIYGYTAPIAGQLPALYDPL